MRFRSGAPPGRLTSRNYVLTFCWFHPIVLTTYYLLPSNHMSYDMFEFVRMDAIVAELTTSSPRTFDIYGFCGIGILSEMFLHGDVEGLIMTEEDLKQEDLPDKDEVKPQNDLTAQQKLVIALEMAEGLAVLHGYTNGLIIHDDVQLSQYLFNADYSILKLSDFTRAEFPLWDEENQEYCLRFAGQQ